MQFQLFVPFLFLNTHLKDANTCEADPTNDTEGRILVLELQAERTPGRKLHMIACTNVPNEIFQVGLLNGRQKLNQEGVWCHVDEAHPLF